MQNSASGHPDLTVMTRNVYFGTDFGPVYAASSPSKLIEAIVTAWAEVRASKIPERAARIAHEIATAKPDLVGLQEIAQWSTGRLGAMSVRYDFLDSILQSLRDEGFFYVPIVVRKDSSHVVPLDTSGNLLQFADRHAVVLRIGPDSTRVRPYNTEAETFSTLFQFSNPVAGSTSVVRSWIAVGAILASKREKFVVNQG